MDATAKEEHAGAAVVELAAIVALNCLNGGAELGGDISKELERVKVSDLSNKENVQT